MRRVRTVVAGVAGSPWYQNLYFADNVGTSDTAVQRTFEFWDDVRNHLFSGLTISVDNQVTLISEATGEITGIDTVTSRPPLAGTQNASMLPASTQLVINVGTGIYRRGREIQGRTFIPGFTEFDNENGLGPNAATVGDVLVSFDQRLVGNPTASLVCYSKVNRIAPAVSSARLMSKWGVLRSRRD